ncbi:hypothetical protein [Glaciibacter psychrotolerans]|uniref:Uncharacterized protein n=1 Tax=Glaciibacter psychrotolerans TaxID=670054 RepID=A0A7Z0J5S7_9MICO|nr:hypothetical protein [Leifsonia psychrotolerans]NYJ19189.1 hypothetical protein [Leifsonia psychrotolerans]
MLEQIINESMQQRGALIEEALEKALVTGSCGVVVIETATSTAVAVSPLVPYGELYQFPSEDAYEMWRNRK